MGRWFELPADLIQIIEDCLLLYVDKVRIRAICMGWNSHLPKIPNQTEMQFPLLLQALDNNKDASHALFNPIKKKLYLLNLPEAQGKLFKRSSHGWVVTIGEKHSSKPTEMCLINPLTRVQIKLPSRNKFTDVRKYRADKVDQEYCVFIYGEGGELFNFYSHDIINFVYTDKVVLSSAPSSDNCLLVAIYGPSRRLACCKLKDKRWRPLLKNNSEGIPGTQIVDIIFHNGKLHALNQTGQVLVFENIGLGLSPKVTEIARMLPFRQEALWKYLVVSSDGGLIMVARYFHFIETNSMDTIPRTYWFKAFKLDSTNLSWVEVKNIGDDILFVGLNSSFSISSRHFPEYKRNHVYFTDSSLSFDTFVYNNREESSDTGVFNLEDGTLQSLPGFENHPKFVWPPPLWVNIG